MRIRELLPGRPVTWIHVDDDLGSASRTLLSSRSPVLPVIGADGQIAGILGEREILAARLAPPGRVPPRDCAGAAMLAAPPMVGLDDLVSTAAQLLLDRGVPAVPVVRDGEVVGIVTMADIVGVYCRPPAAGAQQGWARVADVMCPRPSSIRAQQRLLDAVSLMVELRIRHLPVVTAENVVVGMISDRDVRTALGDPMRALGLDRSGSQIDAKRVADCMTPNVLTVSPETSLEEAAGLIVARRVGALPVVDSDRRLVGVISYVDVMRAVPTTPPKQGAPGMP